VSRSQRLLKLIHLLRSHRFPVSGAQLAEALNISLRTLYRDILTLKEQGASIEGEPGMGYVLRPGFMLPPLMFTNEEIEALVLGSRWVAERADQRLSEGAKSALNKIAAVLPGDLRDSLDNSTLLIGPATHSQTAIEVTDLAQIRLAIRSEHKAIIGYDDLKGVKSTRTVWPFALGYFDHVRVLVAWCELRQGFRHFRTDRILDFTIEQQRYPRRRQALLKDWREIEKIVPSP
jgi:predicted DNA-binding transcriptional regulator YafY